MTIMSGWLDNDRKLSLCKFISSNVLFMLNC